MNEEGKIEAIEPPSFIQSISKQVMHETYDRYAEAFAKGIKDGLKGENTMTSVNAIMDQDKKTLEDQNLHLASIRRVSLDIQKKCLLERRRFLKQAMIDYTDRGEFRITGELSCLLLDIDHELKKLNLELEEITDKYGDNIRYTARVNYLLSIHKEEEMKLEAAINEDAEEKPKPKKTKKSDGNAD